MKTRIITGILLAVFLVPLLFLPAVFLYCVVGIFSLIAAYELFAMYENVKVLPRTLVLYIGINTVWLYGTLLMLWLGLFTYELLLMWLFVVPMVGLMLVVFIEPFTSSDLAKMLLGILYVGVSFAAMAIVFSEGLKVFVYVLILAMVTDMFAYFIGIRFGKHRLAVKISPKKSIEGSIGGTVVAVTLATIFAFSMGIFMIEPFVVRVIVVSVSGVFVSVVAQIGDLVASSLKREHGIKDFSNLFPGHGGILDRFDSSTFAALAMVIVLTILGVIG